MRRPKVDLGLTLKSSDLIDRHRLFSLCDGIFAIAMTLLAFTITVKEGLNSQQLAADLPSVFHRVAHYFLSFYVLARMWLGHIFRTSMIERPTRLFAVLTLVSMSLVGIIPVATHAMSSYPDSPVVVHLYMLTMVLLGLTDLLAYAHALNHHRAILNPQDCVRMTIQLQLYRWSLLIAACAAIVVSLWWPRGGVIVFASILVGSDILRVTCRPWFEKSASHTDGEAESSVPDGDEAALG
ncbi:MAG: TMEM175 family protein [Fimbriimonadaceae bacterium]